MPNRKTDEETIGQIRELANRFSIGYVSRVTGVSRKTVKKYADDDEEFSSQDEGYFTGGF